MSKLNKEEKEVLEAFEAGKTRSVRDAVKRAARHKEYAAAASRKDERINIRLTSKDLRALQKHALVEGVPYQTLAASVLHKFVEGRLKETS